MVTNPELPCVLCRVRGHWHCSVPCLSFMDLASSPGSVPVHCPGYGETALGRAWAPQGVDVVLQDSPGYFQNN